MKDKIDLNIKNPKSFNDIRLMLQEYEKNKEYIRLAKNGSTYLLGFIYNSEISQESKHETIDYTYGLMFADMLEKRNQQIENLISECLISNK